MIAMASMMPSAQASLRYSKPLKATSLTSSNYKNRIHITFDAANFKTLGYNKFQLSMFNSSGTNWIDVGSEGNLTDYSQDGNFYLDVGRTSGVNAFQAAYNETENDGNLRVIFKSATAVQDVPLSSNSSSRDGDATNCNGGAKFLGENLDSKYVNGAGQKETGDRQDYVCWCPTEGDYYDGSDCVSGAVANCAGKTSDGLEKYVVYPVQRDQPETCDYVVAGGGKNFTNAYCDDPAAGSTTHPGEIGINTCKSANVKDCENVCAGGSGTHYGDPAKRTCGEDRHNSANTLNVQNPTEANKTLNTMCLPIADCGDAQTESVAVSPWANRQCKNCEKGKDCSGGPTADVDCAVGKYNDGATTTGHKCVNVPAGHYGVQNASIPSNTGAGQARAIAVLPCPEGYYNNGTGTGCVTSGDGYQATGQRNTARTKCNPGTFSEGAGNCENCPAGKSQAAAGASSCEPCGSGLYSSSGAITCSNCVAGFGTWNGTADANLDNECLVCPEGTYNDGNSKTCMDVPAGWRAVAETTLDGGKIRKSKAECREGTYSADKKDECTPCPAGTFTPNNGTANCGAATDGFETVDAGGTYTATGAVGQAECAAGTYEVNSTCTDCPTGSYQVSNTSTSCTAANVTAGEYVDDASKAPKTADAAKGEVPEPDGDGVTTCGINKYVDFSQTNNTSPNDRGCRDRDSAVDKDLRAEDASGAVDSDGKFVRLKFNYDADHVVVEQLDCGVKSNGVDVMTRTDASGADSQVGATAAVPVGELGICRCKNAWNAAGSVGYPHTTGCANAQKQCIHALDCNTGQCDEASRTSAAGLQSKCVTTYVLNSASDKCYGYHGSFVDKSIKDTWRVDMTFCNGVTSTVTF